jgi:hypothetical protein
VRSTGALSGTRYCMKNNEKENGSQGIESHYIYNSFFPRRD